MSLTLQVAPCDWNLSWSIGVLWRLYRLDRNQATGPPLAKNRSALFTAS